MYKALGAWLENLGKSRISSRWRPAQSAPGYRLSITRVIIAHLNLENWRKGLSTWASESPPPHTHRWRQPPPLPKKNKVFTLLHIYIDIRRVLQIIYWPVRTSYRHFQYLIFQVLFLGHVRIIFLKALPIVIRRSTILTEFLFFRIRSGARVLKK